MTGEKREGPPGAPCALNTRLGWIVGGSIPTPPSAHVQMVRIHGVSPREATGNVNDTDDLHGPPWLHQPTNPLQGTREIPPERGRSRVQLVTSSVIKPSHISKGLFNINVIYRVVAVMLSFIFSISKQPDEYVTGAKTNLTHWQRVTGMFQHFWKRGSTEYRNSPQQYHNWKTAKVVRTYSGAVGFGRDVTLAPDTGQSQCQNQQVKPLRLLDKSLDTVRGQMRQFLDPGQ